MHAHICKEEESFSLEKSVERIGQKPTSTGVTMTSPPGLPRTILMYPVVPE